METKKLSLDQISTVPYYGKSFPFLPRKTNVRNKEVMVFVKLQFKEIGFFPALFFWLALPFRLGGVNREYPKGMDLMKKSFGAEAKMEWAFLILVYQDMEKRQSAEYAYDFIKRSIQAAAPFVMNDMYQADYLAKFEDPFKAFWRYNKAMFAGDKDYPNYFIEDGENGAKEMIITSCRNCDVSWLTIPELAKMGCDHDCVGYPAISEQTQMDFRRPQTIAKGGEFCRFMFFRKGTAPEGLETK